MKLALVKYPFSIGVATLLLTLAAAPEASAMRCGSHLIHEGDDAAQVVAKCGEPVSIVRRSVLRPPVIWHYGRPYRIGHDFIEIPVEIWTYNLGSNRLMRRLRIEDGLVVEITTLSHGYN
jgi:hypothetical protein